MQQTNENQTTPPRILIVDDNPAIHEDFRKILGGDGGKSDFDDEEARFFGDSEPKAAAMSFDLDFASQGHEAIEKVIAARDAGRPFSAVFVDVRMPPGLDGIETSARLWEEDPDLQITICTAYSDYSWKRMVEKLDRTDQLLILRKPFDAIEAVQCAHSLTSKWALMRSIRMHSENLERKVRERTIELEEARDAALESVRTKSRFLANMSHEIRTPMNGVIGMAELLSHTPLDEIQRDYVDTIRHSADLLLGIINDILDSAKIESGKFLCETVDLDIRSVVEISLDTLASTAQAKKIELAGHVRGDVVPLLRGDPARLRQILTNLVGNAIKFTHKGDVSVIVSLVNQDDSQSVLRFSVRDTGIGVAPENLSKIFDPFAQADSSDTRKYGGTGLGLTICRQLVEAMGGKIGVDSDPGQGSTFWFEVAFAKQSNPTQLDTPIRAVHSGLRVLVADDNSTNREILEAATRKSRHVAIRRAGRSGSAGAYGRGRRRRESVSNRDHRHADAGNGWFAPCETD